MNRKSLITFFTLFCCQVLFSQTEFAPVGAEWYYKMHAPIGPMFGYDHFTVVKDTQFLETECRKVRVERVNSEDNKYDEFNFFIYDDNGKVFISYHDNFELLYDFNLNTGDTLKSIIPFEYIFENTPDIVYLNQEADSVETIEISEFLAKKIYLNTTNNIYNFYHITEKIGGSPYFFPFENTMSDFLYPCFRCYHDSEIDITLLKCDSTNNSWLSIENNEVSNITFKRIPNCGIEIYFENDELWNRIQGLVLLNMQGMILKYTSISNTQNSCFISMENLSDGIYIITILTENKIVSNKIYWNN